MDIKPDVRGDEAGKTLKHTIRWWHHEMEPIWMDVSCITINVFLL